MSKRFALAVVAEAATNMSESSIIGPAGPSAPSTMSAPEMDFNQACSRDERLDRMKAKAFKFLGVRSIDVTQLRHTILHDVAAGNDAQNEQP